MSTAVVGCSLVDISSLSDESRAIVVALVHHLHAREETSLRRQHVPGGAYRITTPLQGLSTTANVDTAPLQRQFEALLNDLHDLEDAHEKLQADVAALAGRVEGLGTTPGLSVVVELKRVQERVEGLEIKRLEDRTDHRADVMQLRAEMGALHRRLASPAAPNKGD